MLCTLFSRGYPPSEEQCFTTTGLILVTITTNAAHSGCLLAQGHGACSGGLPRDRIVLCPLIVAAVASRRNPACAWPPTIRAETSSLVSSSANCPSLATSTHSLPSHGGTAVATGDDSAATLFLRSLGRWNRRTARGGGSPSVSASVATWAVESIVEPIPGRHATCSSWNSRVNTVPATDHDRPTHVTCSTNARNLSTALNADASIVSASGCSISAANHPQPTVCKTDKQHTRVATTHRLSSARQLLQPQPDGVPTVKRSRSR